MKILIIDDSPVHTAAARTQLAEHELVVLESADEALELLGAGYKKTGRCDFDVVLADLLMPSPSYGLSDTALLEYAGKVNYRRPATMPAQQVPVGVFFALIAAKNGAKRVGVLTDAGHHDHPASALFDAFRASGAAGWAETTFHINGAKVVLSNDGSNSFLEYPEVKAGDTPDNFPPPVKRWDRLLAFLLQD